MQRENEVQHVFLVGAKSLGAYGGYETFVYKLTEYHQNKKNIKYHVACKANGDGCMDETKVDGATRRILVFHHLYYILISREDMFSFEQSYFYIPCSIQKILDLPYLFAFHLQLLRNMLAQSNHPNQGT